MDFWFEFRLPYSKYNHINDLQQTIHNAVDLIITHDLSVFITRFEGIQKEIDNFALEINKIREKGTKFIVNKIFEILQANYHPNCFIISNDAFREYDISEELKNRIIPVSIIYNEVIFSKKLVDYLKNEGEIIINS